MVADMLKSMKREWEITVLIIMLIIGFAGLVTGGMQAFDFFGRKQEPPVPRVNVQPKFTPTAFIYLNTPPARQLGSNHAMRLQVPQEWLNKKRYEQMLADRERLRKERQAEIDRMAGILAAEKPIKPPVSEKPPEPIPPINHYMVFKGFMTAPSGETLAYLCKEDAQGDVVKRTGASFLEVGNQFKGYIIKAIDDEWLLLNDPDGRDLTIVRGQRFPYGVTENPDYRLEPEAPKTDEDASEGDEPRKKTGKKPAAGKARKPGKGTKSAQQMLQDYLQKNGGKIDQQLINEALKKNGGKIDQQQINEVLKKNNIQF